MKSTISGDKNLNWRPKLQQLGLEQERLTAKIAGNLLGIRIRIHKILHETIKSDSFGVVNIQQAVTCVCDLDADVKNIFYIFLTTGMQLL